MSDELCQIQLTCASSTEADKIAEALLEMRLIVCAKKVPVSSMFWWKDAIESGEEVLLLMDTRSSNFEEIEAEVAKRHSYETFVLHGMPISLVSSAAKTWFDKELRNKK